MPEEVIGRGTASALTMPDSCIAVAGKTGTAQNTCDRWFVGYTPRLLCGGGVVTSGTGAGSRSATPNRCRTGSDAGEPGATAPPAK